MVYSQSRSRVPPQDSINKLIIWKMNLLVVPVTRVKLMNNLLELVCIWSDWKPLNLELIKILGRHLYQIQGNWAARNFVTEIWNL